MLSWALHYNKLSEFQHVVNTTITTVKNAHQFEKAVIEGSGPKSSSALVQALHDPDDFSLFKRTLRFMLGFRLFCKTAQSRCGAHFLRIYLQRSKLNNPHFSLGTHSTGSSGPLLSFAQGGDMLGRTISLCVQVNLRLAQIRHMYA